MNILDINRMRTEGYADQAYSACKSLLAQAPSDRDVRMTMARCLKAVAERAALQRDFNRFITTLQELSDLKLEEIGEISMANRFSWDVHVLFDALKTFPDQLTWTASRITDILPRLTFNRPHKYYSHLAEAFLNVRGRKGAIWTRFIDFMDWFGFENLMPEDFMPVTTRSGRTLPSLAECLYSAYFKALMTLLEKHRADTAAVEAFLDRLSWLVESEQDFQYTLYHMASLLFAIGRRQEATKTLLPFVRKNRNSYWVWELMGDTLDDPEMKLACYCRALMCQANPKFLGHLRIKAAGQMHSLGHDANACAELMMVYELYDKSGWKLPSEAIELSQQEWANNIAPAESNIRFYHEWCTKSDDLFAEHSQEFIILIMSHNEKKGLCTFVTSDRQRGFFFTRGLNCRLTPNRIYHLRVDGRIETDCATSVLSCRRVNDTAPHIDTFYRSIEGDLRVIPGRSFGFVDEIFVDMRQNPHNLQNGDRVTGTAALSFNHKTQSWGWVAASLRPHSAASAPL